MMGMVISQLQRNVSANAKDDVNESREERGMMMAMVIKELY